MILEQNRRQRRTVLRSYKLYVIRHGLTSANKKGVYLGSTDISLSEEGRQEIMSLTKQYEYPKVQKVYSSPLKRAVETAEIIYPNNLIENIDYLRECSFGVFENRSIDELSKDLEYKSWLDGNMTNSPKGGETKEQFAKRVLNGFNYLMNDMMKNRIYEAALVGHAGVLSMILYMFGMPRRTPLEWNMEPGGGYSLLTTAQMWSRDNIFEVCDILPYGKCSNESSGFFNLDYEEV